MGIEYDLRGTKVRLPSQQRKRLGPSGGMCEMKSDVFECKTYKIDHSFFLNDSLKRSLFQLLVLVEALIGDMDPDLKVRVRGYR